LVNNSIATELEIVGVTDRGALDTQMIITELEALEETTIILESLSLDSEAARVAMASDDVLKPLVRFIEADSYLKSWDKVAIADRETMQKSFDICKQAVITTLTSITGETRNSDTLWVSAKGDTPVVATSDPSSWFATKMLQWISLYSGDLKKGSDVREDLVICGTLCIGNLVREGVFWSGKTKMTLLTV
jgi:hypothetical protein